MFFHSLVARGAGGYIKLGFKVFILSVGLHSITIHLNLFFAHLGYPSSPARAPRLFRILGTDPPRGIELVAGGELGVA